MYCFCFFLKAEDGFPFGLEVRVQTCGSPMCRLSFVVFLCVVFFFLLGVSVFEIGGGSCVERG